MHGETGYRFVNLLTGVFIDGAAESRFDRIYQRFTGERRSFDEIARESRWLIMATTLAAELDMLSQLARAHRRRQPLDARLHRERPAQGAGRDRGAVSRCTAPMSRRAACRTPTGA